jgi:sulfate permease, SulP family
MQSMFVPKSVVCFREGYTRESLMREVLAGVVVGIVALPLALAFAIASGVPPERGIYTAIIAGFLISLLGGSRVQIGGPTGAFVVIVYGTVANYGYEGLVVCTVMAGGILLLLGLGRFGSLIKFIPYPVVTGFTAGIGLIIFSSQIKDLLGLPMGAVPVDLLDKWRAYGIHIGAFTPSAVLIGAGTLLVLVVWPRVSRMVPAPFVAMVAGTLAVHLMDLPVETIGSRFGTVPSSLPAPHLPAIPWGQMRELFSPALSIALLAAIESLLSAVVADGLIGTRHKSNMELVAQGVANIAAPIFGGIPATGAIARTATNIKTGGRTPLAGMVHAATLLGILLFAGRWAAMIPLASLAAILVVVSYHMSEWRSFRALLRAPRSDIIVLLLTFFLTVFVDLTVAVQVGVVVASLLFMKRMAEVTRVADLSVEIDDDAEHPEEIERLVHRRKVLAGRVLPAGVDVYEVNGPFFFGAADKLRDVLSEVSRAPSLLILRMRHVPAVDATGLHALEQLWKKARGAGTVLIVSEATRPVLRAMVKARLVEKVGRRNFVSSFDSAVALAQETAAPGNETRRRKGGA